MKIAKFQNIPDMKRTVKASGSHFFDPATMEFFHSKVVALENGSYFVTSEYREDPAETKYTARYFTEPEAEGQRYEDETIGEFQEYESVAEARAAIFTFLEAKRRMDELVSTLSAVGVEYANNEDGYSVLRAEGKSLRAGVLYLDNQATAAVAIGDDVISLREFTSPRGFANYIKGWVLDRGTAVAEEK